MTSKLHLALVAAMAGAFILAGTAQAETIEPGDPVGDDSIFGDYMGSEGYMKSLINLAEEFDEMRGQPCDDDYIVRPLGLQVHEAITINRGDVEPLAGEWVMPMEVERCDIESVMTVHSFIDANGNVETDLMLPGRTRFYPSDVENLVAELPQVIAAAGGEEGCDDISVLAAINQAPEGMQVSNPDVNYETWSIEGCDTEVDVIWRLEPVEDQLQIKVEGIMMPEEG